ncbi:hypothetical protein RF11_15537 [Thelohanellus kitauei]|uniref:Integrase zinc-binding domain-containing protein n=1 Tax=Thelohanellus kitauei TaxID=669202 RepID=A0A0C2JJL8_THEKT|nr:hypothetical protein RF11_15537 [Thelohanellus kitauei]
MRKQVIELARTCITCQTLKVQFHTKTPFENSWYQKSVSKLGYNYLLTIVGRFIRWLEGIPMNNISTQSCTRALLSYWIALFVIPTYITSDRGAHGMISQTSKFCDAGPAGWPKLIGRITLGIVGYLNCCKRRDWLFFRRACLWLYQTHSASAYLRILREKVNGLGSTLTSQHGSACKHTNPNELQKCRYVFVRNDSNMSPLQRPNDGPFQVLKPGPKTFQKEIECCPERILIDRLKPAYLDQD